MAGPTVIDLFAGCGGMTRGFVDAGFTPLLAVEHDLAAAASYAVNFGEDHVRRGDVQDVREGGVPEADVVIGGPPCQGFSSLGSRDVSDPRNRLWREYLRIVRAARPDFFVVENVGRFFASSEWELLQREAHGGMIKDYELSSGVLMAADYGVAQRRPRAIVIGSRIGPVALPEPTHRDLPTLLGEPPWETVRSRIGDLAAEPSRYDLPERHVEVFGRNVQGAFSGEELHFGRRPWASSLRRYDCIPPGGGRFNLPDELLSDCWRRKERGTTDVMGRMQWDRPSLTIRTEFFKPEKGQYLHPQWDADDPDRRVNRVITHLEAARLQDFPDDFRWCGTKTEIARQIGNAVPVGLARRIAEHLRHQLLPQAGTPRGARR